MVAQPRSWQLLEAGGASTRDSQVPEEPPTPTLAAAETLSWWDGNRADGDSAGLSLAVFPMFFSKLCAEKG